MDVHHSHWGDITASRDWCEPNYTVTPYIAEFWNTLSNGMYILCAINLWLHKRRLNEIPQFKQFKSLNITIFGLAFLGIASGSFHATLKYWPQQFDRVFCVVPLLGLRLGFDEHGHGAGLSIMTLAFWLTISVLSIFLVFEIYIVYLAVVTFYRGYMIAKQPQMDEVKLRAIRAMVYCVVALTVWLLDIFTCDFFLYFHFIPHFHALWHLLTALTFHEMSLVQIHLFLMKVRKKPIFVTKHSFSIGVVCMDENKTI